MPPTKRKLAVVAKPASPVDDHEDGEIGSDEEEEKTTTRGRALRPRRMTKQKKKDNDSDSESDKSYSDEEEEDDGSEFSENDSDVDFGSRKKKGQVKAKNGVKGRKPSVPTKPPAKRTKTEPEYSDEEEEEEEEEEEDSSEEMKKIRTGNGVKGRKAASTTKAPANKKTNHPDSSDEEEEDEENVEDIGSDDDEEEEEEEEGMGGESKDTTEFIKNASTCQKCKKEYKNAAEASNCLNKHNVIRCYFCFSLYKTTEELFDHFRDDHKAGSKKGNVSCTHCSTSIPYKSVSCHMISMHMT